MPVAEMERDREENTKQTYTHILALSKSFRVKRKRHVVLLPLMFSRNVPIQ